MTKASGRKSSWLIWGVTCLQLAVGALAFGGASAVEKQVSESPSTSQPLPKLELVEEVYDFGEAPEGDVVSHAFVVKNAGNGELKIHKVSPD